MSQSTPTSRFATRAGVPLVAAFDGGRPSFQWVIPYVSFGASI